MKQVEHVITLENSDIKNDGSEHGDALLDALINIADGTIGHMQHSVAAEEAWTLYSTVIIWDDGE